MINLYNGDCLDIMKTIPDKSIDMILCDLPYGTTSAEWDIIIPFDRLWEQYNRIIKDNCVIALFGNEPFTSKLICSNLRGFKYRIDWDKKIPSGMGYAKYRPMSQIEDICIFTKNGEKSKYYPQLTKREKPIQSGGNNIKPRTYGGFNAIGNSQYKRNYEYKQPTTLVSFDKIRRGANHPTEKPIPLLEYLIKTYTQEGETVLDNCMGSGSTGVACVNTNRKFIGIEKEKKYYDIAVNRINVAKEKSGY